MGQQNDRGYGLFKRRNIYLRAHRVAWTLTRGPLKRKMTVDHLCRNRLCVNPAHLEDTTNKENILRGLSPTAINARKTHCIRGHEFTPANTLMCRGSRNCRACRQWWNEKTNATRSSGFRRS